MAQTEPLINQVRHDAASLKYKREIVGPRFTDEGFLAIPFNETPAWKTPLGKKHWFEIPLGCAKVRRDTSLNIEGRLFTTAMVRQVDDGWPELDADGKYPAWLTDPSQTDPTESRQFFKTKVAEFQIRNVLVLARDNELEAAGSKHLFDFYAALGLQTVRCPTHDFNCPNPDAFKKGIELLSLSLIQCHNTLIHCWGGSGRTGVYIVGLLKNFGVKDPMAWARQVGKSVYIDVGEQEEFVSQMQLHITPRMVDTNRPMVDAMIKAHMESNDFNKVERHLDDATVAALTTVFESDRIWSEKGDLTEFLGLMSRTAPISTPMTAPDRAHMEAGSGAIGDYPLPSPEGDHERQPTPLAVAGDYWSNTLDGYCMLVQPAGLSVEESALWT